MDKSSIEKRFSEIAFDEYGVDVPENVFEGAAQSIICRMDRNKLYNEAYRLGFVILTQKEYRDLRDLPVEIPKV